MRRSPVRMTLATPILIGAIGWVGVVMIGLQLAAASADSLGFDLELLLQAGREIAAGRSPYAPGLIGGSAPTATSLFYSYPPPVGQAMVPFAGVPSTVMLTAWGVLAVGGLLLVTDGLRRRLAPERRRAEVLAVVAAAAPLTLPFAVGLLFGNVDVFFPLFYGAMLVAVLAPSRGTAIAGGAGLVLASLKIHPISMGLWFLVRSLKGRQAGPGRVLGIAVVIGVAIAGASVGFGGTSVWADYAQVVRSGTNAIVVDPRNAGIAATLAGLLGGDDGLARGLHLAIGVAAVVLTGWAAWRRDDPLESFAWATAASLSTLPVTWYHYPSAMIPVAIAAGLRAPVAARRRVGWAVVAAGIVAAVAIAWLPLLWLAIGLVIVAARWSRAEVPARASG